MELAVGSPLDEALEDLIHQPAGVDILHDRRVEGIGFAFSETRNVLLCGVRRFIAKMPLFRIRQ